MGFYGGSPGRPPEPEPLPSQYGPEIEKRRRKERDLIRSRRGYLSTLVVQPRDRASSPLSLPQATALSVLAQGDRNA